MKRPARPAAAKTRRRPQISVDESPTSLKRLGLIALGGFVIGIVWPRLAGISLVPDPPLAAETAVEGAPKAATEEAAPLPENDLGPKDLLEISEPQVTSCKDAEGGESKSCSDVNFDDLLHASVLSLAECPAAQGVFGTLSLGIELNFAEKKVTKVQSGRSTDLPPAVRDEILRCAEKQFQSLSLAEIKAEHASYNVYFKLLFKTPAIAASEAKTLVLASGRATVEWRTALVREEADHEAKVRARVLAGTRVTVNARMGDWYRVIYDDKGREGWIHGAALGLVEEK
jgi:Bacterial SH3 domain